MNSEDIKKALTTCAGDSCDNCRYYEFHNCYDKLKLDARDLIIKQEQEIKQLKTECTLLDDELRNARQETINAKLQEILSNGCNWEQLAQDLLSWLSDDEVGEFARAYEWF